MRELDKAWLQSRVAFEDGCSTSRWRYPVLGDVILYIDTEDDSLTPCLKRDGYWESWISLAIAKSIKPGSACIDAGAHIGYYSALMSMQGAAVVYAFEPQPNLASLLRKTVAFNKFPGMVEVYQVALSDRQGSADLLVYGRMTGSASFIPVPGLDVTGHIPVKTTTLDSFSQSLSRLDFIKIDCEGAETAIWAGMKETIRRFPELTIVMEVDRERAYDLPTFIKDIETEYPLRVIDYEGEVVPTSIDNIMSSDKWSTLWLQRT